MNNGHLNTSTFIFTEHWNVLRPFALQSRRKVSTHLRRQKTNQARINVKAKAQNFGFFFIVAINSTHIQSSTFAPCPCFCQGKSRQNFVPLLHNFYVHNFWLRKNKANKGQKHGQHRFCAICTYAKTKACAEERVRGILRTPSQQNKQTNALRLFQNHTREFCMFDFYPKRHSKAKNKMQLVCFAYSKQSNQSQGLLQSKHKHLSKQSMRLLCQVNSSGFEDTGYMTGFDDTSYMTDLFDNNVDYIRDAETNSDFGDQGAFLHYQKLIQKKQMIEARQKKERHRKNKKRLKSCKKIIHKTKQKLKKLFHKTITSDTTKLKLKKLFKLCLVETNFASTQQSKPDQNQPIIDYNNIISKKADSKTSHPAFAYAKGNLPSNLANWQKILTVQNQSITKKLCKFEIYFAISAVDTFIFKYVKQGFYTRPVVYPPTSLSLSLQSPVGLLIWIQKTAEQLTGANFPFSGNRKQFNVCANIKKLKVRNAKTLNYTTMEPEPGGLFCHDIFGPGENNFKRRRQFGYIELARAVTHVWYLRGIQNYIGILLNRKKKQLERLAYCVDVATISPQQISNNLVTNQQLDSVVFNNRFKFQLASQKTAYFIKRNKALVTEKTLAYEIHKPSLGQRQQTQLQRNNQFYKWHINEKTICDPSLIFYDFKPNKHNKEQLDQSKIRFFKSVDFLKIEDQWANFLINNCNTNKTQPCGDLSIMLSFYQWPFSNLFDDLKNKDLLSAHYTKNKIVDPWPVTNLFDHLNLKNKWSHPYEYYYIKYHFDFFNDFDINQNNIHALFCNDSKKQNQHLLTNPYASRGVLKPPVFHANDMVGWNFYDKVIQLNLGKNQPIQSFIPSHNFSPFLPLQSFGSKEGNLRSQLYSGSTNPTFSPCTKNTQKGSKSFTYAKVLRLPKNIQSKNLVLTSGVYKKIHIRSNFSPLDPELCTCFVIKKQYCLAEEKKARNSAKAWGKAESGKRKINFLNSRHKNVNLFYTGLKQTGITSIVATLKWVHRKVDYYKFNMVLTSEKFRQLCVFNVCNGPCTENFMPEQSLLCFKGNYITSFELLYPNLSLIETKACAPLRKSRGKSFFLRKSQRVCNFKKNNHKTLMQTKNRIIWITLTDQVKNKNTRTEIWLKLQQFKQPFVMNNNKLLRTKNFCVRTFLAWAEGGRRKAGSATSKAASTRDVPLFGKSKRKTKFNVTQKMNKALFDLKLNKNAYNLKNQLLFLNDSNTICFNFINTFANINYGTSQSKHKLILDSFNFEQHQNRFKLNNEFKTDYTNDFNFSQPCTKVKNFYADQTCFNRYFLTTTDSFKNDYLCATFTGLKKPVKHDPVTNFCVPLSIMRRGIFKRHNYIRWSFSWDQLKLTKNGYTNWTHKQKKKFDFRRVVNFYRYYEFYLLTQHKSEPKDFLNTSFAYGRFVSRQLKKQVWRFIGLQKLITAKGLHNLKPKLNAKVTVPNSFATGFKKRFKTNPGGSAYSAYKSWPKTVTQLEINELKKKNMQTNNHYIHKNQLDFLNQCCFFDFFLTQVQTKKHHFKTNFVSSEFIQSSEEFLNKNTLPLLDQKIISTHAKFITWDWFLNKLKTLATLKHPPLNSSLIPRDRSNKAKLGNLDRLFLGTNYLRKRFVLRKREIASFLKKKDAVNFKQCCATKEGQSSWYKANIENKNFQHINLSKIQNFNVTKDFINCQLNRPLIHKPLSWIGVQKFKSNSKVKFNNYLLNLTFDKSLNENPTIRDTQTIFSWYKSRLFLFYFNYNIIPLSLFSNSLHYFQWNQNANVNSVHLIFKQNIVRQNQKQSFLMEIKKLKLNRSQIKCFQNFCDKYKRLKEPNYAVFTTILTFSLGLSLNFSMVRYMFFCLNQMMLMPKRNHLNQKKVSNPLGYKKFRNYISKKLMPSVNKKLLISKMKQSKPLFECFSFTNNNLFYQPPISSVLKILDQPYILLDDPLNQPERSIKSKPKTVIRDQPKFNLWGRFMSNKIGWLKDVDGIRKEPSFTHDRLNTSLLPLFFRTKKQRKQGSPDESLNTVITEYLQKDFWIDPYDKTHVINTKLTCINPRVHYLTCFFDKTQKISLEVGLKHEQKQIIYCFLHFFNNGCLKQGKSAIMNQCSQKTITKPYFWSLTYQHNYLPFLECQKGCYWDGFGHFKGIINIELSSIQRFQRTNAIIKQQNQPLDQWNYLFQTQQNKPLDNPCFSAIPLDEQPFEANANRQMQQAEKASGSRSDSWSDLFFIEPESVLNYPISIFLNINKNVQNRSQSDLKQTEIKSFFRQSGSDLKKKIKNLGQLGHMPKRKLNSFMQTSNAASPLKSVLGREYTFAYAKALSPDDKARRKLCPTRTKFFVQEVQRDQAVMKKTNFCPDKFMKKARDTLNKHEANWLFLSLKRLRNMQPNYEIIKREYKTLIMSTSQLEWQQTSPLVENSTLDLEIKEYLTQELLTEQDQNEIKYYFEEDYIDRIQEKFKLMLRCIEKQKQLKFKNRPFIKVRKGMPSEPRNRIGIVQNRRQSLSFMWLKNVNQDPICKMGELLPQKCQDDVLQVQTKLELKHSLLLAKMNKQILHDTIENTLFMQSMNSYYAKKNLDQSFDTAATDTFFDPQKLTVSKASQTMQFNYTQTNQIKQWFLQSSFMCFWVYQRLPLNYSLFKQNNFFNRQLKANEQFQQTFTLTLKTSQKFCVFWVQGGQRPLFLRKPLFRRKLRTFSLRKNFVNQSFAYFAGNFSAFLLHKLCPRRTKFFVQKGTAEGGFFLRKSESGRRKAEGGKKKSENGQKLRQRSTRAIKKPFEATTNAKIQIIGKQFKCLKTKHLFLNQFYCSDRLNLKRHYFFMAIKNFHNRQKQIKPNFCKAHLLHHLTEFKQKIYVHPFKKTKNYYNTFLTTVPSYIKQDFALLENKKNIENNFVCYNLRLKQFVQNFVASVSTQRCTTTNAHYLSSFYTVADYEDWDEYAFYIHKPTDHTDRVIPNYVQRAFWDPNNAIATGGQIIQQYLLNLSNHKETKIKNFDIITYFLFESFVSIYPLPLNLPNLWTYLPALSESTFESFEQVKMYTLLTPFLRFNMQQLSHNPSLHMSNLYMYMAILYGENDTSAKAGLYERIFNRNFTKVYQKSLKGLPECSNLSLFLQHIEFKINHVDQIIALNNNGELVKPGDVGMRSVLRVKNIRKKLINRLKLLYQFVIHKQQPSWLTINYVPVIPPGLRPVVPVGSGQLAVSDLNKLYQKIIFRNDRFGLYITHYTRSEILGTITSLQPVCMDYWGYYFYRLLQESVDGLIENGKSGVIPFVASNNRPFKSLSDMLKGKQGRFRLNLLGKRVDYSGRSVIVVGPQLKLHQCGLPKEIAIILFQPFLIRRLLKRGFAYNMVEARAFIKQRPDWLWQLLANDVMQHRPLLLNRAPTLHRVGVQAFVPKLVQGRAILLHPLVCTAFNADFDGDQMAVHIPLSVDACSECWTLMFSRTNLLSPATGDAMIMPTQDMILGCYYLTNLDKIKHSKFVLHYEQTQNKQLHVNLSGCYGLFNDVAQVIQALEQNKIHYHDFIWLKWQNKFEFDHKKQTVIEVRMDSHGNMITIYPDMLVYYNQQFNPCFPCLSTLPGFEDDKRDLAFNGSKRQTQIYLKTTPGRVMLNDVFLKQLFNKTNKMGFLDAKLETPVTTGI